MSPRHHFTSATPDEVWPLVRDHHYSGRLPGNIQHVYAIRLDGGLFGDFGDVIAGAFFSVPPTRWSEDVLELSRLVRSPDCFVPMSRLVAFAAKMLRGNGHNLLVSFADWTQRHHGGVYQSCGWNYGGCRDRMMDGILLDGVFVPGRSCNSKWGTRSPDKLRQILPSRSVEPHYDEGKHLYWLALHNSGSSKAKRLGLQSLPYPKPSAGRPMDERAPARQRQAQPLRPAPNSTVAA